MLQYQLLVWNDFDSARWLQSSYQYDLSTWLDPVTTYTRHLLVFPYTVIREIFGGNKFWYRVYCAVRCVLFFGMYTVQGISRGAIHLEACEIPMVTWHYWAAGQSCATCPRTCRVREMSLYSWSVREKPRLVVRKPLWIVSQQMTK